MPKSDGVHPLPVRQRQVLELIASGLTSVEVGRRLGISVRTVQLHRAKVMQKLQARNLAQLIRQAVMRGLVDV